MVLAVGCLAVFLVIWRQLSEGDSGSHAAAHLHATYSFTCCRTADINTVRHPGETFVLHWISTPGSPSPALSPVAITLSASLSGPFQTVLTLKKTIGNRGPGKKHSLELLNARPTHITAWDSRPPLTTIAIPRNAPTGLYSIKFTISSAVSSISGDSIIRVGP